MSDPRDRCETAPSLDLVIEGVIGREPDDGASQLPACRGVLGFEDEQGRTISLAATADLRRCARSRLAAAALAGAVRLLARASGSAFEAEWVWLAQARLRLPRAYQAALDRWPAWFIHVDPEAAQPRLVKTARPGRSAAGASGAHVGPFLDKHSAARYMELLDNTFDLCRYHHILAQAPRGTACAYKQMGRCPAPCDGSVTMDAYREQVRQAVRFAAAGHARWKAEREREMAAAAAALEFERAAAIQRRLGDAAHAARPQYRHVNTLDAFRWLAVAPAERAAFARLFAIDRGRILHVTDAPRQSGDGALAAIAARCDALLDAAPDRALTEPEAENIGLVCRHLFRPRSAARETAFLPAGGSIDAASLGSAIRRACGRRKPRSSPSQPAEFGADDADDLAIDALGDGASG